MPKTKPDVASATAPVANAPAESVAAPKKAKPRYVNLQNRSPQTLFASVVNDNGGADAIKIDPQASSPSVREDRLTPHTRNMISMGLLRVR